MPLAEVIRSRSNPLYKRLAALKQRADQELCLIEGPKLVEEALDAGVTIREAIAGPKAEARRGALLALLRSNGVPVRLLDEALVASLSDAETSQGLVAIAERPQADEARLYAGTALILVAVTIQNPGNLGALLRTAEAAGATGAYLTSGCADPYSWKALRGSMGSAFRLPVVGGLSLDEALARLQARQVPAIAATADAPESYDAFDWRGSVALLLGNESAGLPPEVARAAARVRIPMIRTVESLNVSAAAAVLLFEAARQRRRAT